MKFSSFSGAGDLGYPRPADPMDDTVVDSLSPSQWERVKEVLKRLGRSLLPAYNETPPDDDGEVRRQAMREMNMLPGDHISKSTGEDRIVDADPPAH